MILEFLQSFFICSNLQNLSFLCCKMLLLSVFCFVSKQLSIAFELLRNYTSFRVKLFFPICKQFQCACRDSQAVFSPRSLTKKALVEVQSAGGTRRIGSPVTTKCFSPSVGELYMHRNQPEGRGRHLYINILWQNVICLYKIINAAEDWVLNLP